MENKLTAKLFRNKIPHTLKTHSSRAFVLLVLCEFPLGLNYNAEVNNLVGPKKNNVIKFSGRCIYKLGTDVKEDNNVFIQLREGTGWTDTLEKAYHATNQWTKLGFVPLVPFQIIRTIKIWCSHLIFSTFIISQPQFWVLSFGLLVAMLALRSLSVFGREG